MECISYIQNLNFKENIKYNYLQNYFSLLRGLGHVIRAVYITSPVTETIRWSYAQLSYNLRQNIDVEGTGQRGQSSIDQ